MAVSKVYTGLGAFFAWRRKQSGLPKRRARSKLDDGQSPRGKIKEDYASESVILSTTIFLPGVHLFMYNQCIIQEVGCCLIVCVALRLRNPCIW